MKQRYLSIMDCALSAYSEEDILAYFDKNKKEGLTEHGFCRLTSNIGILIANGYRMGMLPLFCEMMEFCCSEIPTHKAANDFSVREIVSCITELEERNTVDIDLIAHWKALLLEIERESVYNIMASSIDDCVNNWAVFTAASEWFRDKMGLCDSNSFVAMQVSAQLKMFDENGMYRDPNNPMVYDLVTRGLFGLLLSYGYDGENSDAMSELLRKAGILTLQMQSVTGEIPFGGRSNQFLFNETLLAIVGQFEENRYIREGNPSLASEFHTLIDKALSHLEMRLAENKGTHIKNHYPVETCYGCEGYGYFLKYMITVASFAWEAYLIYKAGNHDLSIIGTHSQPIYSYVMQTSVHFHKVFQRYGDYFAEWDTAADFGYDASGLGRLQKKGLPSPLCLSVPATSSPHYTLDMEPMTFSIAAGILSGEQYVFGCDKDVRYTLLFNTSDETSSTLRFSLQFPDDRIITEEAILDGDGMTLIVSGEENDRVAVLIPVFAFDGKTNTEITADGQSVSVSYHDSVCTYRTDGVIVDTKMEAPNKNGHYRIFHAYGNTVLKVHINMV